MITIFSTLKPMEGHIGIIQRNAVTSWTKLKCNPEVILLGDETGVAKLCDDLNIKHIPNVECNEYGRPLIKDLFKKGQKPLFLTFVINFLLYFYLYVLKI